MFLAVPSSYDIINRVLTLRLDEWWRSKAAKALLDGHPRRILDLCTGTGDLALRLKKNAPAGTRIFALDYSRTMLNIARKKARGRQLGGIEFLEGDAADMPFEDNFFDAVGIAFAFRNLTYKNPDSNSFLHEILRVLRPGGKFVAVETSQPEHPLMRYLFHGYMRMITAPVGGLLSGHRAAYRYLAQSAINYYNPSELKEVIIGAGFRSANSNLLMNGVAAVWDCRK